MAGLSATGFDAKALDDIQSEIVDFLHSEIDPTLNLTETSILGQAIGAFATQLRAGWEAIAATYVSRDPSQAEDDALEAISEITGTIRAAATYSTMTVTCTLAAGSYAAGDLIVYLPGSPDETFTNDAAITTAGPTEDLAFTATVTGPIQVPAATTLALSSPPSGFTAAVSVGAAAPGSDVETIPELRIRRERELRRQGSTSTDAVRVDVDDVAATTYVTVYENDTDATNGDGMPPHSIEVVVVGGDDDEIATAILASKAAGIQAHGSTTVTAYDDVGNAHTIKFSRPTSKTIYIHLDITAKTGTYLGDSAVQDAITEWTDVNLSVGIDVLKARIESLAMSVDGVINVLAAIDDSYPAAVNDDFVIGGRERAIVTTANIEISTTYVNGAP